MDYGIKHKRKLRERQYVRATKLFGKSPHAIAIKFFIVLIYLKIADEDVIRQTWALFQKKYHLYDR